MAEYVLCVNTRDFTQQFGKARWDHGVCLTPPIGYLNWIHQNKFSVERTESLETNFGILQVIPYVVVYQPTDRGYRFLIADRSAGDTRLVKKTSLGFGGHARVCESVWAGARRELEEELGIRMDSDFFLPCGLLWSDASEVDLVHLGVICGYWLPETKEPQLQPDSNMENLRWIETEMAGDPERLQPVECTQPIKNWESWSRLLQPWLHWLVEYR